MKTGIVLAALVDVFTKKDLFRSLLYFYPRVSLPAVWYTEYMQDVAVNYLAVLVAGAAAFVFGWLWYGPLFGKKWMAMMGYTAESMKAMTMTPKKAMTFGFLSMLVMSFVLANFASLWQASGVAGALSLTFWIWLGFIAMVAIGSVLWENRSWKLYFFNITYYFISLFIMTLVLVLWK